MSIIDGEPNILILFIVDIMERIYNILKKVLK